MKMNKIAAMSLAALMTLGAALPAAAPVLADYDAEIDTSRTGSVTLHKIIENDGKNKQADGHPDASLRNTPLDQIEFSYMKIADWLMEADDLGARSTTGLYFTNLDPGIFGEGGVAKKAGINVTVTPTVFSHEVTPGSAEDLADGVSDGHKKTTAYTTKAIEDAWSAILAAPGDGSSYTGETALRDYIKAHGTAMPAKTDAAGKTSVSGLELGLYGFGETDITAHDGINPQTNQAYEVEQGDANPENPIVESPAKPFLVSFPMTNVSDIQDGNVTYRAGTVWEYDFHVYPKDQTTTIIKRIIDPDEDAAGAKLRTNEDYQIGEVIEQVILADAPALQKDYVLGPAEQNKNATVQPAVTHKTYRISDEMTEGYHFKAVTKVALGAKREQVPATAAYFGEGFADLAECSYETSGAPRPTTGDYYVTGRDGEHAFSVTFTEAGLQKLDALTVDSQVAVFFRADLDSRAKIGTDDHYMKKGNMNKPTLEWRNSNTLERSVEGNRVYVYTYELDITKTGLTDLTKATFVVSRKDSDTVSVPLQFIKETEGVYHIFDANGADQNVPSAVRLSEIHPDAAGKLNIKGFDSKTYTFKETATQGGFDLLKETFDVSFQEDEENRDGELTRAVLTVDGASDDLDIEKGAGGNGGLVRVTIENHKTVTLRTGGAGRWTVIGAGSAGFLTLIGIAVVRRKRLTA